MTGANMSFAMLAVVVALGAVALAVAGLRAVRLRIAAHGFERHNEVVGHVYATLSVLYSVLLAFVVVTVWERYVGAREIVEREANALEDLFQDAQAYPPEARDRVRRQVYEYARAVLDEEWRTMEQGRESPRAVAAIDALWNEYYRIQPGTETERLWHQRGIERLNDLGDERTLRILRSRLNQPRAMTGTLYVLGIVIVGFSYLFGVENFRIHAILTGTLAGTLAVILVILSALDHPFGRLAPIDPLAFQEAVHEFQQTPTR